MMKKLRYIAAGLLLLPSLVMAGGNLIQRDPNDIANILERKWDSRMLPLSWALSSDGQPGSTLTNQQIADEFTAAFDQWQNLATTDVNFLFEGEVDRRSGGLGGTFGAGVDGFNLITFTDPDFVFPAGVLAVSLTTSFDTEVTITAANSDLDGDGQPDLPEGIYSPGTIFDGDIIFNGSLPFEASGTNNTLDLRAVALHEIGHHIGLSHSSIPDAVMWPFLSNDITLARALKLDDIAYASMFYPDATVHPATYGTISGNILNGSTNIRILGAHVYALDTISGQKLVGAYTLNDGTYVIPVPAGDYFVGIEPLDGDPMALDPARINEVIRYTFDTNFPEELYDTNEANVEADPQAAVAVTVTASVDTPDINIITNTVEVPGVSRVLLAGYNLFSYPVATPTGTQAYDLLQALGDDTEITSIDRFNTSTGTFDRASYINGVPSGVNFPITRGEGFIVHSRVQKTLGFTGSVDCPAINLRTGLNLIGVPCPPAGYSAFDLLQSLGQEFEVANVQRFNPDTQTYDVAAYDAGVPAGIDFPVANGEAYVAEMFVSKDNVRVPASNQVFPPNITGISPGRAVPGTIIIVLGSGFDPDPVSNVVNFNGVGTQVLYATPTVLTLKVPYGATTGPVRVTTNGRESNSVNFIVESAIVNEADLVNGEIVSGQQVNGDITADGEQDRYTFVGLQGTRATIEARAVTTGSPDLLLILESPSGVMLITDDDSAGGTDPMIRNFELPESGVYSVVVTSVPGTGLGPYTLDLDIVTSTTAPTITILEGQAQSGLAGSQLPIPFKILISGPTGSPIGNIPVNLVAQNVNVSPTASTAQGDILTTAGSTSVSTNGNGVAYVTGTLPNDVALFQISITVPGFPPVTIFASSIASEVSTVEITGNDQNCGGTGCTVNENLPEPYQVRYLDGGGNPVEGVLTFWKVVSGSGELVNFEPQAGSGSNLQITTNAQDGPAGIARVTHKLGTQLYHTGTIVPMPQLVAATIHGQVLPVLFGATPKAGAPGGIVNHTTNFRQMTVNTGLLNGIQLTVKDQFGNPVEGATIQQASGIVTVAPGLKDGQMLTTWQTDERGQWTGAVYATNIIPTIDELGLTSSAGLASRHNFSVRVVENPSLTAAYNIDVDMGPAVVSVGQGSSALITKDINNVGKRALRWQRIDTYIDTGGGTDDDAGDWLDETNFSNLQYKVVPGVSIDLSVSRSDREDETAHGLTASTFNGQSDLTVTTDGAGDVLGTFTMGDVGGAISLTSTTSVMNIEFRRDLNTSRGQDGGVITTLPFTDEDNFAERLSVRARPFIITITLEDPAPAEPTPDPYPGIASSSGINLSTLLMTLNGSFTLFNGPSASQFSLGDFPYNRRILLNDSEQAFWPSAELITNSGFQKVELIIEAPGNVMSPGSNTIEIIGLEDNVGYADALPEPAAETVTFP